MNPHLPGKHTKAIQDQIKCWIEKLDLIREMWLETLVLKTEFCAGPELCCNLITSVLLDKRLMGPWHRPFEMDEELLTQKFPSFGHQIIDAAVEAPKLAPNLDQMNISVSGLWDSTDMYLLHVLS